MDSLPNGEHLLFTYPYGFYIVDSEGGNVQWIEGGIKPEWVIVTESQPSSGTTTGGPESIRDLIVGPDNENNDRGAIKLKWTIPSLG